MGTKHLQSLPGCSTGLLLSGLTSLSTRTAGPGKNCRSTQLEIWRPRAISLAKWTSACRHRAEPGSGFAGQGKQTSVPLPGHASVSHTHCVKSQPSIDG